MQTKPKNNRFNALERFPKVYSELDLQKEKIKIAEHYEKYYKNRYEESGKELSKFYLVLCALTLRDEAGFGKKRIERSLSKMEINAIQLLNGEVKLEEIIQTLEAETGMNFEEWFEREIEV